MHGLRLPWREFGCCGVEWLTIQHHIAVLIDDNKPALQLPRSSGERARALVRRVNPVTEPLPIFSRQQVA